MLGEACSHGADPQGHQQKASRFTAGPSSRNPGRAFYTCPLGRDDPARCKFFEWADNDEPATPRTPVQERLQAAATESKKRRLDDTSSPFNPTTHSAVEPVMAELAKLSEHIQRQDRLLVAADKAKEGFRRTIADLQQRNAELEQRIRELEDASR
jgi:hypothetical protein